jgi:hypothetical protein
LLVVAALLILPASAVGIEGLHARYAASLHAQLALAQVRAQANQATRSIGRTIVMILLDLVVICLIGGLHGHGGMVTSNATGSNIFLLTRVLSLAALPSGVGLAVAPTIAHVDVPLLLAVTLLVTVLFRQVTLDRRTGMALLVLYVAYIVYAPVRGGVSA